ncbi:MAG: hypothetical protein C6H99_02755 [Epsilonproteobacteria bacterium]|nr:hypothetical protein [Campylobacterota bacterium]NPA64727.1 hypothetical protein [Campylobacterota bacterium]
MKKSILLALLGSLAFAGLSATPQTYGAYEDFDAICKDAFGQKARLANWRDIKKAYEKAADKEEFVASLGLESYDQSLIVKNESEYFEEGDRHYIVTLHNGTLPTNYTYLVHDTIDAHTLDLGSWRDIDYPALCIVE